MAWRDVTCLYIVLCTTNVVAWTEEICRCRRRRFCFVLARTWCFYVVMCWACLDWVGLVGEAWAARSRAHPPVLLMTGRCRAWQLSLGSFRRDTHTIQILLFCVIRCFACWGFWRSWVGLGVAGGNLFFVFHVWVGSACVSFFGAPCAVVVKNAPFKYKKRDVCPFFCVVLWCTSYVW